MTCEFTVQMIPAVASVATGLLWLEVTREHGEELKDPASKLYKWRQKAAFIAIIGALLTLLVTYPEVHGAICSFYSR